MRAAFLLLVVVVLGGLLLLYGPCALLPGDAAGGIRGQPLLDVLTILSQESERGERLDTCREAILRCIAGKDRAVADLLEGRADLLEVAAVFRDWQEGVPDYHREVFHQAFPGRSEEESLCLAVIAHVEKALDSSPGEQAAWAAKLRLELKVHQERGTLRLRGQGPALKTPSASPTSRHPRHATEYPQEVSATGHPWQARRKMSVGFTC